MKETSILTALVLLLFACKTTKPLKTNPGF